MFRFIANSKLSTSIHSLLLAFSTYGRAYIRFFDLILQSPKMMLKTDVWLLAALYFYGAVDAAISTNYTQAILSSGTGKRSHNSYMLTTNTSKSSLVTGKMPSTKPPNSSPLSPPPRSFPSSPAVVLATTPPSRDPTLPQTQSTTTSSLLGPLDLRCR